jgi:GT2 family glycosyltransferase
MPRASIIIVAFNNRELLSESLHSLANQTCRDFEVIVVDNDSADGTYDFIKTRFPDILCIRSDENLGFAGGNNLGLKRARGEYVALLNSDAAAQPEWLARLAEAMETHPDVGICASKMIVSGTDSLDSAGDGFSANLKGFKRGEDMPSGSYDKEEYIFGACAGAALYRRKMLDEIGFFDEDFFLIQEDTDLNLRAQLAGWKVLYVPSAEVYHKVRSTIGHMSDTAIYYTLRNCEFVRIKNIPAVVFLRHLPEYILGSIADFIFFAIRHGKFSVYAKAKIDAIKQLKTMLGKRRRIMNMKKVDSRYIGTIIIPIHQRDFLSLKLKKFFHG